MNTKFTVKYNSDLRILVAAVAYFMAARLGYVLAFPDNNILPVWPPSGVAFALIILLGRASWPGIAIGALLAHLMGYWNDTGLSQFESISVASILAYGQVLETLTGNVLMKKWIKETYPFRNAKNTFRFLFAGVVMSVVGATIGVLGLYINDIITKEAWLSTTITWWAANVVGILLFTPLILSIARLSSLRISAQKVFEGAIVLGFIGVIFGLIRFGYFNGAMTEAMPYLSIPVLLWLSFRFELHTAIAGAVVISLFGIYYTINFGGPFIQDTTSNSILLLQLYTAVICLSTIVLAATVTERQSAQEELQSFNQNLESIVKERTKSLDDEINTRKKTEEKLIRSNQELSKRNTELDNFVYKVSHDLRAPICSVLGLINLARNDRSREMKNVYLDKINQSAVQQDDFIKEILDQSRNSRLEVSRNEIQFEHLIEETFTQLQFATATGKPVERVVEVSQNGKFYSDQWRLKVILNNIISNAIRYRNGRDPKIKVNVTVNNHVASIEVEDNGRGISKEHIDNVCTMFYRATDEGAGSGLGLYIVKETIEKLNGTIGIESVEGKGTKVRVEIPELVA